MAITYSKYGTFVHEELTAEQIESLKAEHPKLYNVMFGEMSTKYNREQKAKANEPKKKVKIK